MTYGSPIELLTVAKSWIVKEAGRRSNRDF